MNNIFYLVFISFCLLGNSLIVPSQNKEKYTIKYVKSSEFPYTLEEIQHFDILETKVNDKKYSCYYPKESDNTLNQNYNDINEINNSESSKMDTINDNPDFIPPKTLDQIYSVDYNYIPTQCLEESYESYRFIICPKSNITILELGETARNLGFYKSDVSSLKKGTDDNKQLYLRETYRGQFNQIADIIYKCPKNYPDVSEKIPFKIDQLEFHKNEDGSFNRFNITIISTDYCFDSLFIQQKNTFFNFYQTRTMCRDINTSYWKYHICEKGNITQYHNQVSEAFSLGVYNETATLEQGKDLFQFRSSEDYEDNYIRLLFTNGTRCHETETSRMTEVRYVCNDKAPMLPSIVEYGYCKYIVYIYDRNICSIPKFEKPFNEPMSLYCVLHDDINDNNNENNNNNNNNNKNKSIPQSDFNKQESISIFNSVKHMRDMSGTFAYVENMNMEGKLEVVPPKTRESMINHILSGNNLNPQDIEKIINDIKEQFGDDVETIIIQNPDDLNNIPNTIINNEDINQIQEMVDKDEKIDEIVNEKEDKMNNEMNNEMSNEKVDEINKNKEDEMKKEKEDEMSNEMSNEKVDEIVNEKEDEIDNENHDSKFIETKETIVNENTQINIQEISEQENSEQEISKQENTNNDQTFTKDNIINQEKEKENPIKDLPHSIDTHIEQEEEQQDDNNHDFLLNKEIDTSTLFSPDPNTIEIEEEFDDKIENEPIEHTNNSKEIQTDINISNENNKDNTIIENEKEDKQKED